MERKIQKLTHPAVLASIILGAFSGLAIVPANAFVGWTCPMAEFGSRLALADLQTSKQQKLSSLINSELLLLVVVDSACAPCESSKDIMKSLRKTAAELKVAYLPKVLKEFAGDLETQRYAERLGFETCIEWPTEVPLRNCSKGQARRCTS